MQNEASEKTVIEEHERKSVEIEETWEGKDWAGGKDEDNRERRRNSKQR